MKIIIDEFERLARCKGYRSGNELFKELGGGRSAYQCIIVLQTVFRLLERLWRKLANIYLITIRIVCR